MIEDLQVVNENDEPIGSVNNREEAWEKRLILRHSHMVIRDKDGNFLLQQRSMKKKSNPGIWTWSASGHVDTGESYEVAAHRELKEEIGIDTPLTFVGKWRASNPRDTGSMEAFISLFEGIVDKQIEIVVDPEEVETTRWISYDDLRNEITTRPDNFTRNMRRAFNDYYL